MKWEENENRKGGNFHITFQQIYMPFVWVLGRLFIRKWFVKLSVFNFAFKLVLDIVMFSFYSNKDKWTNFLKFNIRKKSSMLSTLHGWSKKILIRQAPDVETSSISFVLTIFYSGSFLTFYFVCEAVWFDTQHVSSNKRKKHKTTLFWPRASHKIWDNVQRNLMRILFLI